MKQLIIIFTLLFSASLLKANQPTVDFFQESDQFFKKYVTKGLVDYKSLKGNAELTALVNCIANADISSESANYKQAFYINAYNILVIKQVVDNAPVESVLKVKGFFDVNQFKVAGKKMTLNQLEKDVLLKQYKNPKFHFVLVCGAIDCPPITNFSYKPDQLSAQINSQTKKALNNPNFIKVSGNKVELSQIFEWYAKDFGGSKSSAIAYINEIRVTKIPSKSTVSFYSYDWTLNKK